MITVFFFIISVNRLQFFQKILCANQWLTIYSDPVFNVENYQQLHFNLFSLSFQLCLTLVLVTEKGKEKKSHIIYGSRYWWLSIIAKTAQKGNYTNYKLNFHWSLAPAIKLNQQNKHLWLRNMVWIHGPIKSWDTWFMMLLTATIYPCKTVLHN